MRVQILKPRKFSRSEVFSITYLRVFSKLKNVLSEIHLLLTPDGKHGKAFEKIPIIGFRRARNLKDSLVRVKVAPLRKEERLLQIIWREEFHKREYCEASVISGSL